MTALSILQSVILDGLAEGKSPRQLEAITGVPAAQVYKVGLELLESEVLMDTDSKRKLQLYRLEKIIEALWTRVQQHADRDDVKNLIEVMDRVSALLALNKEVEANEIVRATQYQSALYINSLRTLMDSFKAMLPGKMTDEQWDEWAGIQLEAAKKQIAGNVGSA